MSSNSRKRSRRERMKTAWANDGRGESCRHRTLAAIREHLESEELYVFEDPKDGRLALDVTLYPPEAVSYRNRNGDAACQVIVNVYDEGFVEIASPAAWNLRDCSHRAAVYESLVRTTNELPIVRFQYDPEDDGVSPIAIVPIGDRGVSCDVIMKVVASVLDAILRWDPVIRRAMEAGEASVPSLSDSDKELSPDEESWILHNLGHRLAKEVDAMWKWAHQKRVGNAGSEGTVAMLPAPRSEHLRGTAALVHRDQVLGLTRTLGEGFKRAVTFAAAKALNR